MRQGALQVFRCSLEVIQSRCRADGVAIGRMLDNVQNALPIQIDRTTIPRAVEAVSAGFWHLYCSLRPERWSHRVPVRVRFVRLAYAQDYGFVERFANNLECQRKPRSA